MEKLEFKVVKREHIANYRDLTIKLDNLRTAYEDELTSFVKDSQNSEDGLDIEELGILVDLDGNEPLLVYAIRVNNEDIIELQISPTDEDWVSIYDFYPNTAIDILSSLMENYE
jgi:hypothetical protein